MNAPSASRRLLVASVLLLGSLGLAHFGGTCAAADVGLPKLKPPTPPTLPPVFPKLTAPSLPKLPDVPLPKNPKGEPLTTIPLFYGKIEFGGGFGFDGYLRWDTAKGVLKMTGKITWTYDNGEDQYTLPPLVVSEYEGRADQGGTLTLNRSIEGKSGLRLKSEIKLRPQADGTIAWSLWYRAWNHYRPTLAPQVRTRSGTLRPRQAPWATAQKLGKQLPPVNHPPRSTPPVKPPVTVPTTPGPLPPSVQLPSLDPPRIEVPRRPKLPF